MTPESGNVVTYIVISTLDQMLTFCVIGTDEKALIDVLGYRSCSQRQEVVIMFKTMFGKARFRYNFIPSFVLSFMYQLCYDFFILVTFVVQDN